MNYPYYIVTWHEGRLPCPLQYRGTVIAKQFTSGHIGGKRHVEKRTDNPREAYRLWNLGRADRVVYEVADRNRPRRRMRTEELAKRIADAKRAKRNG